WGKWPTLARGQVEAILLTMARPGIGPDEDNNSFPNTVKHLNVYNAFAAGGTMPPAGGALLGLVVDANTGQGLAGATITIIPKTGGTSRTTTTRADGTFTATNLPAGTYKVSASKPGYVTTTDEVEWEVREGCWDRVPFIALPRTQASDVYTVVLEWRGWCDIFDLDSYLWLPDTLPPRNRYMVYWLDRGNFNVHPFARLLRDEPGEMPERTWWPLFVEALTFRARYTGTYRFAVNSFGGGTNWACADAVVRLYRGSSLVGTFLARNATGSGVWWNVFTVSGTTVAAVNQLTTEFPGPYGEDILQGAPQKKAPAGAALPQGQYKYRAR
ncbi:MAG: carboxypeptidase-like regulatory domain-containing protein, partial [Candidatus Bipolaricaulaceae bacterium]